MGRIFGTILARVKHLFGEEEKPSEIDAPSGGRGRRWKRTLLLVPLMVTLIFAAAVEHGHPAAGKTGKGGIMAALMDPLALFAERSPGERGGGALLSTKGALGPSERVLSEVRDRDPGLGDPPADAFAPVTPEDIAALPDGLPGAGGSSGGPPGGGGPGGGGAPGGPGFSPFFSPFTPGGGDPGDPGTVGSPPGTTLPPPGGVSAVPEPATWAMLILGFFAVGIAVRRRARRQTGPSCVR